MFMYLSYFFLLIDMKPSFPNILYDNMSLYTDDLLRWTTVQYNLHIIDILVVIEKRVHFIPCCEFCVVGFII